MKQKTHSLLSTPNIVSLITGLLLFSLAPQAPINERFTLFERVATALIFLLLILFLQKDRPKSLVIPIPITLLLIVVFLSLSQMPSFSFFKDAVAFALISIFAIIAISLEKVKILINGAVISSVFLIVLAVVYIIFFPANAFEETGELRGAFYGSNSLAISLVMLSPALCAFKLSSSRSTWLSRIILLVATFVLIYLSTSQTSAIVFIVIIFSWFLLYALKRNVLMGLFLALGAFIALIFIALYWTQFTSILGKSPNLSGRVTLWQAYLDAILVNPLLGYGWHIRTITEMPLGDFIVQSTGYSHINANNDLLNWWALTGLFGATFAAISILYLVINGLRLNPLSPESVWVFLTGIVLLVGGLTELSSMHPDGWLLLNFAFVSGSIMILSTDKSRTPWLISGSLRLKLKE